MSDTSAIEWTDATWNPTVGCRKVSEGCDHCYAERLVNGRLRNRYPDGFGTVILHHDRLDQPLHWRKPRRVFVNSLSDLFEDQVPDEFIARVFAVMAEAPQHTFQILTKRPGRMASLLGRVDFSELVDKAVCDLPDQTTARLREDFLPGWPDVWPLRNVWLGTSVENQRWADVRVPLLLRTNAAVRFLSCEPLLGPVNLQPYVMHQCDCDMATAGGRIPTYGEHHRQSEYGPRVDWVIAGGESGPEFRSLDLGWIRGIRDQCQAAGVAFFFKQVGGRTPKAGGRLLDGRTWDEYPAGAR